MKKIFLTITVALVFNVTSCDDFGDTNLNPNAAETPLTSALLTNAQAALGGSATGGSALVSGFYCQYFTQTQYTENSIYAAQDVDWGSELAGSMTDLTKIIEINSDPKTAPVAVLNGSNNNQIAIARILKAFRFSILTDRYGDMPYSEALKGNLQPKFDTQDAIYSDLFKELKESVAQIDNGNAVRGDILYAGDMNKWKRFANTLRMILALRLSNVDANKGKSEFVEALANGGFSSNAESAILQYPGGNFKNPWFALAADYAIAQTMSDYLNLTNDARKNAFGKPGAGGTLVGVPYGLKRADAVSFTNNNTAWSKVLNDQWRLENSALPIITYADGLLARAEAAQLGWTNENASQLLKDGIKASWDQWNVYVAAAYNSFTARPEMDLTTGDPLAKIRFQRWVTFYPNGPQGWSEWRRTNSPALIPTPNAVNNSKQIPVRFPYPSVEFGYNNANMQEAIGRLSNGNFDNSPVWWDK